MSNIYKYLPIERDTYLKDALLRFTPPGALNDPFELLPALTDDVAQKALDLMKKELLAPPPHPPGLSREERRKADRSYQKAAREKLSSLKIYHQSFTNEFLSRGNENINSKLGILSLSRRWNSGLMWSHYASSHAGYCVGFNRNHPFFNRPEAEMNGEFMLRSVIYSTERPTIPARYMHAGDAMQILLTKSTDWEYEEEERGIALLQNSAQTIDAKPFNIELFEVPHQAVSEIILGLRASLDLKNEAIALAARIGAPLFQATISKLTFDVERSRVNA